MNGRVAFVTGASRGAGAAIARAFHAAGAKVALASRSGDDLGLDDALGLECDVRDPEQVQAAVDATVEAFGRLDIVVANAGVGSYGDFLSMASVGGLRALPGEAVYNASKFGQLGFTRALDHELREQGVRATCVCPGGIATDFAMGTGREAGSTDGMMSAEDVADTVLYCVTRPRSWRMLTMSYRPLIEGSWG